MVVQQMNTVLESQTMEGEQQMINYQLRDRTKDIRATRYTNFQQFKLKQQLLLGLTEQNYLEPTPVQEQSIPMILQRRSLIARAKNGTGKTAAYLIPILNEIKVELQLVQAVVLVPTRELAQQVRSTASKLSKFLRVKVDCFIGGTSIKEDSSKLHDIHLMVCTPGRLKDLLRRKRNLLEICQFFVMDQADQLLRENFEMDVEEIMRALPCDCVRLMYSATFPLRVKWFREKYMKEADVLNLMEELMLIGLTHYYMLVNERQKMRAIFTLYGSLIINQCIIFCRSNRRAEELSSRLNAKHYVNEYLHSNMKPQMRRSVFQRFRKGEFKTLVSSNLVARGIDVPTVNVVINFDFPNDSSTYLHRIGRSGRFGQIGLAINLITQTDQENVLKFEKQLETKIDPMPKQVEESLYR